MITQVCQYLKNWFERAIYTGKFAIVDGVITSYNDGDMSLVSGQYFRIIGSLFNDGVHKYDDDTDTLTDETFEGAVWSMGVPGAVIDLVADISDWQSQYGTTDSAAMSPYNSESFGGYSYSKSGGGSSDGTSSSGTWQSAFAMRLSPWRKI